MQREEITQKQIAAALGVTEGYISAQFGGRKLIQKVTLDCVYEKTDDYEFVHEIEVLADQAYKDRHPPRGAHQIVIHGEKRMVTEGELVEFYIKVQEATA